MGPSELRGERGGVSPMAIATYAAIAALVVGGSALLEGDGESRRTTPLPERIQPVAEHRHTGLSGVSVDWIEIGPDGEPVLCHTHHPKPGFSPIPNDHCEPLTTG